MMLVDVYVYAYVYPYIQVFVPKENCAFMFAMTEVRCPQPPKAGETR